MTNLALHQRVWYHPPGYPTIVTDGALVCWRMGVAVISTGYSFEVIHERQIVSKVTRADDPDARFESERIDRIASGEFAGWREANGG